MTGYEDGHLLFQLTTQIYVEDALLLKKSQEIVRDETKELIIKNVRTILTRRLKPPRTLLSAEESPIVFPYLIHSVAKLLQRSATRGCSQ